MFHEIELFMFRNAIWGTNWKKKINLETKKNVYLSKMREWSDKRANELGDKERYGAEFLGVKNAES